MSNISDDDFILAVRALQKDSIEANVAMFGEETLVFTGSGRTRDDAIQNLIFCIEKKRSMLKRLIDCVTRRAEVLK